MATLFFSLSPRGWGHLEDIMATTTILTNKGTSIINKAITDGAKCVISRVITSTHYENAPTDLSSKAPHWWDGAEGTVTGLSLVNASLDIKVHWEAQLDAQPVKSIGIMVKRAGADKDYLLYAESYSNNALSLAHALDKIFSLPINASAETFDAIGNTLTNEMNEELAGIGGGGGGSVDTSNLGSSLFYDSETKQLELINTNGEVISGIDATAFIKDGMLDSVTVSGGNLNFVFNTDAGKESISIPLSEFFDASAYYTKAEIDGSFLNAVTYNANTNSLDFASGNGARTVSVSLD